MAADRDLINAYRRSGPAAISSQEVPASRSHFIGMVQAEPVPSTENSEPDSILPAIDGKVDSEAGSESNNSESDDDGTAFARDVMIATGRLHGVYMAAPAATNAEEEENPEEGEHTPSKEGKSLNDTDVVIEDGKKDTEFPPVDELPAGNLQLSPSRKADPPAKKADLKKKKPDLRAQKADLPPKKAELPPKKLEVGGGSGVNKKHEGKKKPAAAFEDPNEIDEYDLLRTPIDANEPPEFLEARRQALLRQTAALETKRKELKGAQNAIAEAHDAVEEYERRVRRSAHKKLPGLLIPDDHPVRRRLEKVDWTKEITRTNYKGEPVYGTPAVNATAAYAILNDDRYTPDEKLKYSNVLLGTALQQQERGETRSSKLLEDSYLCRSQTGAGNPSVPGGLDSHKSASKEPKKDKTPPRERDAASKTGSSAGKHGDGNRKDNTTRHKEAEPRRDKDREAQNRKGEQHATRPTRAARDRNDMPPPRNSADNHEKHAQSHNRERSRTPPRAQGGGNRNRTCLLYTSPSPRDGLLS